MSVSVIVGYAQFPFIKRRFNFFKMNLSRSFYLISAIGILFQLKAGEERRGDMCLLPKVLEMEASIMDNTTLNCGAVVNLISLAASYLSCYHLQLPEAKDP
ncbi:hypothetical protein VNO78_30760 [Psophocarpus tetragonolobus]|uniref:Uncharacterized protein n=1 Tax=Psophocarpus tetragonolobus TaxID=3891 RepID=A0AAN9RXY1_PSOTE